MASVFSDNINFIGDKPNFDRDKVTTLAQLACEDPKQKRYPYGHIVFCEEDGRHYKFNYNHKAAPTDEGAKSDITGWFVPLDEPVDLTAINACVEQNSALISQESNRATTAETALADAVSINNHALQQEVSRATTAEDALSGRISDSVGRIADIESVMSSSTEMLDTLENVAAWIQDDATDSADIVAHVNENNEAIKKLQFHTHGVEVDVVGSQYAVTQAVMAGQNVTFRLLDTDNASLAYAIYVKYGEKGTSYHLGGKYISLGEVVSITATIDFDRVMLWAQGTTADEYKLLHVSSDSVTLLNQLSDIKTNVDTLHKRNIRQGLLKNGVPVLSKTAKTLTLPSGTLLLGGNKMLTLSSDLVIDNTSDPDFGSHYIAIDLSSQAPAYRLIRSMSNITLNNDNEFIIALLDWSLGFVWVNSRTYIVDGVTYKKEIALDTISDMQNDISNIDATLKKSQLETTGYEAVCLSSYTYFPAINRGDKIEISLLTDVSDANLAIYVSDKQYPPSGYAVNIGYLKTGGSVTLDVPDKFDSISYIKLWANGMDNIEKVVRIKSKDRTLTTPVVGKFYNVPLNLKKPNLKILDIGNSYTENATQYINNLLINAGVTEDVQNHSHYIAVRGGASFKSWYDCYHDADKTDRYYITHKSGKPLSSEPSWTDVREQNSDGTIKGEFFRNLLNNTRWDLIIIHQASTYSADYDKWEKQEAAGYLKEFIRLIKETNPQAAIGTYLVHSYNTNHENYSKYGTSFDRWKGYCEAVKSLKQNYGIDFVIAYGTAVQNLRASSLQDEYEFSSDGTHLGFGLGCYVASCCYFQSLFAPRYDVNIVGNTYNTISPSEAADGVVPVNPANALVAQKAALLAVCDMFSVQNPEEHSAVSNNGVVGETHNTYGFDAAMSSTSTNAVQNKVVKAAIDSQRTELATAMEAQRKELLKRIQGTDENSSASKDSFKVLGSYTEATLDELISAMDAMHAANANSGCEGVWRAYIGNDYITIRNIPVGYTADKWMQIVSGRFTPDHNGNPIMVTQYREWVRTHNYNYDDFADIEGWSAWQKTTKQFDTDIANLHSEIKTIDNAISVVPKQLGTFSVISELLAVLDGMCPQGGENSYEKYIAYVGKEQVTVENNRRVDGETTVWHQTLRCHRRLSSVRNSKNIVYGDGGAGILIDYAQSFDFPSYSPTTSLYHDNTVYGEYCRKKIYYSTSTTKENGVWNRWEDMNNPYRSMQSYAKRIAIFGGSFVQYMGGVWENVDTSKYAFTHAGRRYFLVDYLAERLNAKYFDDYAVGGNGNSITTDSAGTPVFAYNTYFQVERSFNTDRTTPANLLDDNSNVYDIYIIMLGINDYAKNIEVGKATDDKNLSGTSATFCSSLKKSIDYIRANAPNAKILMITPFKAYKYAGNTVDFGWNPDTYTTNDKGYKFLDYVRAFKEVAYVTSCPCYDLLSMQNFSGANVDTYYTDGTHPNGLGYYKVADMLAEFIATGMGHGLNFNKTDDALSLTSTNTVQNKVIAQAIEAAVERGKRLALKTMFESVGAVYNDTGQDIIKNSAFGILNDDGTIMQVTHKAGHWLLNDIGDLTDDDMLTIYNKGEALNLQYDLHAWGGRTNISFRGIGTNNELKAYRYAYNSKLEVINFGTISNKHAPNRTITLPNNSIEGAFWNSHYLQHIVGAPLVPPTSIPKTTFNCVRLRTVFIKSLSSDISFEYSPNLSKESVLYMIENSLATKEIFITLHPDTYMRLSSDADIASALETKNAEFETISASIKLAQPE